ncbi:MAG: crotonase/enoyl-CoA hydratase family protein [Pirellulales bacterium]|nr:crotonase/enoyl-CoA hydratase family protein [Pirellulales bacterium]
MSSYETISLDVSAAGVARLTLNRPEARNALSQQMIDELRQAAGQLATDAAVRVVVLSGAGEVFCAGGDLKGMQQQVQRTRGERVADATQLAQLLADLDRLPKPLIGRINGSAFGGGLGLISICDLAIGVTSAKFALTEVRLGLIPATISPYVVARLGVPHARRVMLTAHEMDAAAAVRFGLLEAAVDPLELDGAVDREITDVLRCAPGAVARAKELIRFVSTHDTAENIGYTAERLADAWESAEIAEGIMAFFEKRKPAWHVPHK